MSDDWFVTNFLFIVPFYIMYFRRRDFAELRWNRSAQNWLFGFVILVVLIYPGERIYMAAVKDPPIVWKPTLSAKGLSAEAERVWQMGLVNAGVTDPLPIKIISGGVGAAAVANILPGRTASWFENFSHGYSPWIDDDELMQFGTLHIGPLPADFSNYGLCVMSKSTYDWYNNWGKLASKVPLYALLSKSLAPENCID